MLDSKPDSTQLVIGTSLTATDDSAPVNATMYHQLVGDPQNLRMTHLDISFVVNKLSHFMHAPSEHHWGAIKCLLHYLNGTSSLGVQLLGDTPLALQGFSDADWASNPDDRTSTMDFLIFLGANPISWSSTKQRIVSRSSIEAEYRAIAVVTTEL